MSEGVVSCGYMGDSDIYRSMVVIMVAVQKEI